MNFNSPEITEKLANKVSSFSHIDFVMIIDNCSTDGSYNKLIRLASKKIYVERTPFNGGYSYGNNYGMEKCAALGATTVFISNPDVNVEENDVNLIITYIINQHEYAILTGVEYNINMEISDPPIFQMMDYWDDVLDCFFLYRKFNKHPIEKIDYTKDIQNIGMFKGSFFAVNTAIFEEVGGFDENVFLFCEERILSNKMQKAGYKVGLVTHAKYVHEHSFSINKKYKSISKQMALLYKSRLYYNKKYNEIGRVKQYFLQSSMSISLLEFKLLEIIHSFE